MGAWVWLFWAWLAGLFDDEEDTESEHEDLNDDEGDLVSPNGIESDIENITVSKNVWQNFVEARFDQFYSPEDIILGKIIVPEEPGLYAWYFEAPPGNLKGEFDCNGWTILYIGIAPIDTYSKSNLYKRICKIHLGHRTDMSTLRFSLAFLLKNDLNLQIYPEGTSFSLGKYGEKVLTNWMTENCRVYWQIKEQPWLIEEEILKKYGSLLPLNIKGNKLSPIAKKLSYSRSTWKNQCLHDTPS